MKRISTRNKKYFITASTALLVSLLIISSNHVLADGLTPEIESQIETYKEKLTRWSNDKDIIQAVKEMNARVVSMNNKTWESLAKDDPKVIKYQQSTAGKKLTSWQKDKQLGKLFLRDNNGNFVAGSKKPAIFNIAERKAFAEAITGKPWNSKKAKPDPTTRLTSVQISAPVIQKGKSIGVIHTSLIVE